MLLLNAVKDGHYDWIRHQSDKTVNEKNTEVLKDGTFEKLSWELVIVGDILKVNNDEEFPADMVFLCSSDSQGFGYVETTNFDGDSNLKVRNAIYQKAFMDINMSPSKFSGLIIKCEHPNNRLHEFEGVIKLQGTGRLFLDETKILLRGATLRNTSWILGCVIFTGRDTKVLRNMSSVSQKVSHFEGHINMILPIMVVLNVFICFCLAIAGNVWMARRTQHHYLPGQWGWPDYGVGIRGTGVRFLRFFILMHGIVPITLYMSLELVKVFQCLFVDWDLHMYSPEANRRALASASGIPEELGQVEYVMADKTGTLTQNVMTFVCCSIGGVLYGKKLHVEDIEIATGSSVQLVSEDDVLRQKFTTDSDTGRLCCQFFTHLALCHNAYPRLVEEAIEYQTNSPDEAALVKGAAECGFHLDYRSAEEINLYLEGIGLEKHTVLAVLDFTWDRKRMSVICKNQQGRVKLYCKGTDTAILKRLRNPSSPMVEATIQHIEEFSRNGYRTLCIAERELRDKEFEIWAGRFLNSSTSEDDGESQLAIAAETIERDMVLLGATAVEDKLQEGVAETITQLAQAGIRVWVLTGDKIETAVTISLSCNLLADSMHLFFFPDALVKVVGQMLKNMLDEARHHFDNQHTEGHSEMAVVIEGHSLSVALEAANQETFLRLCQICRTVVCCRVTPLQKVQVTRLVRSYGFMVAAVGDGANDVGMIKAAQIGVGIRGREGNEAVAASDYSIGQFRFLARLLLVHGRWSSMRNKDLALYIVYKNVIHISANFFFSFFSAYSVQSIFPEILLSTYNMVWTLLPVVAVAIWERDVCHYTAENNPQLYLASRVRGTYKFAADISFWALTAIWHAIVAFFLPYLVLHQSGFNGESIGLSSFGATVYILEVVIVSVKLAVHSTSWIPYQILLLCASVCSLFLFLLLPHSLGIHTQDFDILSKDLFGRPTFWLLVGLSPIAACLPDVTYMMFQQRSNPADSTILRERENGWQDGICKQGSLDFVDVIHSLADEEFDDGDSSTSEIPLETEAIARKKTWREIVCDDRFDATDHTHSAVWDGKKSSKGFHMVTHLNAPHQKPRPLHKGPKPSYRMSARQSVFSSNKMNVPKAVDGSDADELSMVSRRCWKIPSQHFSLGASPLREKLTSARFCWKRTKQLFSVEDCFSVPKKSYGKSQQPKDDSLLELSLHKPTGNKSHLFVRIAPEVECKEPVKVMLTAEKHLPLDPVHSERIGSSFLKASDDETELFGEDPHPYSLIAVINPNAEVQPNLQPEIQSKNNSIKQHSQFLMSPDSNELRDNYSTSPSIVLNPEADLQDGESELTAPSNKDDDSTKTRTEVGVISEPGLVLPIYGFRKRAAMVLV
ncbi:uncharacterized protein [Physcomitrium patens]